MDINKIRERAKKRERLLNVLPKEILDLEEDYNEFSRLGYNLEYNILYRITMRRYEKEKEHTTEAPETINIFQDIFESTISEFETMNPSDKDIIAVFIRKLIEPVDWERFYLEKKELAQKFAPKLANVMTKYGGYRTICGWPHENPCFDFWWIYKQLTDEKKYIEFMQKINAEVNEIIKNGDEDAKKKLLPKISLILKFFNLMAGDETEETIKELDKVTVTLLNLCIEYEYKLDCLSELGTPLTSIFGNLNSKETKNFIIQYLIGYTDYFQGLRMDSSGCVINTEYPEYSGVEKSEVFRMYLENALLLKRKDLYNGEIFDKVLNKLFRIVRAERNGEVGFWGEDSPEDFSKALLVIEEICNNPDNFKLLIDSDFFDKIYKMFNFFMFEHYKSNKHLDLQNADLYDIETKMKIRFFKLSLTVRKQQSGQKIQGEFHLKR